MTSCNSDPYYSIMMDKVYVCPALMRMDWMRTSAQLRKSMDALLAEDEAVYGENFNAVT